MRILSYACCGRQSHEKKKKTERLLITTLLSLSLSCASFSAVCDALRFSRSECHKLKSEAASATASQTREQLSPTT